MSERTSMNGKPVFTVPAKSVINFQSHFDKKLLCDGMTFTAGDACAYSCSFCYVESMQNKRAKWFEDRGVTRDHFDHVIRRENAVEIARKQIVSKPEAFRTGKYVIYASPLVDVAGNMELVRETVEICKVILELTNWDIRLLSKSNLLPKVAQMLSDARTPDGVMLHNRAAIRVIYGVSTGTLDDNLAAAFEQGTPKVSKRIESLRWLQDNGFRTFGMICPSLPQDNYHQFALDMACAIRADRCEEIWAEIINARGDSFTRTEKALTDSGYISIALELRRISHDKDQWEEYARAMFLSHAEIYRGTKSPDGSPKLKHLQYVTKETAPWWEAQRQNGAVLL